MSIQTVTARVYPQSHTGPGIYIRLAGPRNGDVAFEKLDRYKALKLAEDLVKAVAAFEADLIPSKKAR